MATRKTAKKPAAKKKAARAAASDPLARIVRWMEEHAPRLAGNLAAGARSVELDALEKKHRLTIPADLRKLWMQHDGQIAELNGFVGSLDLLGAASAFRLRAEVLRFVEICREDASSWRAAGMTEAEVRSDAWLPIANRDSDWLVVSAVSGRVFDCGKDAPPLDLAAPSVDAWLEAYATAIEAGEYDVTPGFGTYYLQRSSPFERKLKASRARARSTLSDLLTAGKRELGAFGKVRGGVLKGLFSVGVRFSVMRPVGGDRASSLRRALEANAFALVTRTFVDGESLVTEATLPIDATEDELRAMKRELAMIEHEPFQAAGLGELQQLDAETIAVLHRRGYGVALEKNGAHHRVGGARPILAARLSDTFQMRGLAAVRLPSSERGLELVNAINVAESKAERRAAAFAFGEQLGAGAGTFFLGEDPGRDAEKAYWAVDGVLEQIERFGAPPRGTPDEIAAALAKKAAACLTALAPGVRG